jgi:hypothetical protein
MSFHFIVKMKGTYSGPRYDKLKDRSFEIQVRTIAMDAWATASHYLDYKSDADVPSSLRRDFYALSGLFYVADRHFEMFFNSKKAAIEEITESLERREPHTPQELNLDSFTAFLRSEFPNRKHFRDSSLSELLGDLRKAGVESVDQLKALVDEHYKWFLKREKRNPPSNAKRFAAVGVVRIILEERLVETRTED